MGKGTALAVLALAGVSFAVSVSVSTPATNATVGSPVTIEASASSSHPITGWRIYVDSSSVYAGGATQKIAAAVTMAVGTHQVIVRAWDSTGAYGSANLRLIVSAPKGVTLTVSSPTSTNVTSPVTIAAHASSLSSITGWYIYVDSVSVYSGGATASISTPLTMSAGTHQVLVRAWDSTGAYGSANLGLTVGAPKGVTLTVSSPTITNVTSPVTIVADASSSASITGWHIYVDSVSVYSDGATKSISTPLTMSAGTHHVLLRAWDSTGAYGSATLPLTVVPGTTPPSSARHIFIVAEENTSYGAVVGNTSQMPYFNSLIAKGTLWGNYYSNVHGSMLAYIETLSGQTFNCTGNDCKAGGAITGPSLMAVMNARGLAWKGYFDGLTTCGQLAPQSTNWIINPDSNGAHSYYQRHTGFPWYAAGTATIGTCSKGGNGWWPISQFSTDLATKSIGQLNWITPDGTSDGHDGTLQQIDAFLQKWLTPLLASSYFQPGGDGILIIWWDEAELSNSSCGGPGGQNCGGRIPVVVLGPGIRVNNVDDTAANHDSALRFIQEQLGLTPSLGNSVNVSDMNQTLSTP